MILWPIRTNPNAWLWLKDPCMIWLPARGPGLHVINFIPSVMTPQPKFLDHTKLLSVSGPLHLPFLLLAMLSFQLSTWLAPSHSSVLSFNVSSSKQISWPSRLSRTLYYSLSSWLFILLLTQAAMVLLIYFVLFYCLSLSLENEPYEGNDLVVLVFSFILMAQHGVCYKPYYQYIFINFKNNL